MKKSVIIAVATLFIIEALAMSCAREPMTTTVTRTTQGPTMTSTVTTTQTTTSTVTITQPPVTTTVSPPTMTARELAATGGQVFALECYVDYCHGPWAAVASEEFAGFNYTKYQTAEGLLGSISDEEYLQVEAFILTELGMVPDDALFGPGNLDSFELN